MEDKYIETCVRELAAERDVTPVAAIERGSRMVGVSHDNSDWDVFLLFAQDPVEYATISGYRDTISKKMDNDDIDIHGWNVKKLAKLGTDSNPSAAEFLMSEKQYFNELESDILDRLAQEIRNNFNHMELYHHYLSLARSNYEKYIASGDDCTSNRQFYVARATAYATFIRKRGAFPQLDVWDFLDVETCLDDDDRFLLQYLSHRKEVGKLGEMPDKVGSMLTAETEAEMNPTDERINTPDKELFNKLVRQSVNL